MSSSRIIGALLVLAIMSSRASSAQTIEEIARDRARIIEEAGQAGIGALLPGAAVPDIGGLGDFGPDPVKPRLSVPAGASAEGRYGQRYAFLVSMADEMVVKIAMERAAARGDVVVLFRGIAGDDIGSFFRRLEAVVGRGERSVPMAIDPRVFRRVGLARAPATLDLETGRFLVGVLSVEALEARPEAAGEVLGPTEEILERDFTEVLAERAAAIDEVAAIEGAKARFWKRQRFVVLPLNRVERERRVEPVVVLQRDILGARGEVVAPAGTQVNPLDNMSFGLTLVIFDPFVPEQVTFARAQAAAAARPVLIATRLQVEDGWARLDTLQADVGGPVFLLDEVLRRRIRVEGVPSVVTAEGRELVIREYVLEEGKP